MKIEVLPLLNGSQRVLPFEAEEQIESALLAEVRLTKPVRVSGKITNQAGYMTLHASVEYSYQTECARCLAPIDRDCALEFEKGVADENTLENEDRDDFLIIKDHSLDLTDEVTEQIYMELPYRELCREDCKGLCPHCGKDLNEGACACETKKVDPRLSVLAKLLEESDKDGNI